MIDNQESRRCYNRVSQSQKLAFLDLIRNAGPRFRIKQAAERIGIKYPRATAIYRKYCSGSLYRRVFNEDHHVSLIVPISTQHAEEEEKDVY